MDPIYPVIGVGILLLVVACTIFYGVWHNYHEIAKFASELEVGQEVMQGTILEIQGDEIIVKTKLRRDRITPVHDGKFLYRHQSKK